MLKANVKSNACVFITACGFSLWCRLEHCNDVLERQVATLQVSLEKQKRSQSVAEIKIRSVEQAKADADRRNTTLQREMEMFFQIYGEVKRRRDERGRVGGSL